MPQEGFTDYIEQTYTVKCKGRDKYGKQVLQEPVKIKVKVYQSPGSNTISSSIDCQYNTGGHGQRCKASHPDIDKAGEEVFCPYSFDIPYALERK